MLSPGDQAPVTVSLPDLFLSRVFTGPIVFIGAPAPVQVGERRCLPGRGPPPRRVQGRSSAVAALLYK
jgi:hypothetical protein